MAIRPRHSKNSAKLVLNQRRNSFASVLISANHRAHEQANRRGDKRALKSVQAAIAATELDDEMEQTEWPRRLLRWSLGAALLPFCWVTAWTFLCQFFQVTVKEGFWHSTEFWYFATGSLVMLGWFWSGLLQSFFLYLYVLGHELTHAFFVVIFRGKVTDFHVSADGGYITTNKTNLVIALSPYFVPFWSTIFALIYLVARLFFHLTGEWDRAFYGITGVSWTFHMVWTLWMIPRDQPDLKENGTFLSLVIILLGNLLVLVALLCLAREDPFESCRKFAMDWLRVAATSGDVVFRYATQAVADLRAAGRL